MKSIDLHCDTISSLFKSPKEDSLNKNSFQVDVEGLKQIQAKAQFFALFVDLKEQVAKEVNPTEYCLEMLDYFHCKVKESPDLKLAKSFKDLKNNQEAGKISAFLTIEEGGVLQGEVYNLRNFYRLGVRAITLCWNYPNGIGYPNTANNYSKRGLTPFGEDLIQRMNELGMLVDVSHLSDQGVLEALNLSSDPIIASHSNCRRIKNHLRNLSDDLIKKIADSGGIIGVNFAPRFLGASSLAKIEDIVRHVNHLKEVGGLEVIALGSDFDGFKGSSEIKEVGKLDELFAALKREQFSDDELEKISYGNVERIIKEVLGGELNEKQLSN